MIVKQARPLDSRAFFCAFAFLLLLNKNFAGKKNGTHLFPYKYTTGSRRITRALKLVKRMGSRIGVMLILDFFFLLFLPGVILFVCVLTYC